MRPSRLFRGLVRWHRWLGLAASVFILWLAVSGVLIHHAADFGFGTKPVRTVWVLDHYQVGEPEIRSFKAGERWLSQAGKSLYLDGRRIGGLTESPVGAAALPELLVVATRERLLLLDPRGELIEDLRSEHGLPVGIRNVVGRNGRIVLDTAGGTFEADPVELRWRPARATFSPPTPAELPANVRAAIAQDARARELSYERLVRDLHSGAFFGTAGRWTIDLAALALLGLATTGIWIWWRARREFRAKSPADADRARGKRSR